MILQRREIRAYITALKREMDNAFALVVGGDGK